MSLKLLFFLKIWHIFVSVIKIFIISFVCSFLHPKSNTLAHWRSIVTTFSGSSCAIKFGLWNFHQHVLHVDRMLVIYLLYVSSCICIKNYCNWSCIWSLSSENSLEWSFLSGIKLKPQDAWGDCYNDGKLTFSFLFRFLVRLRASWMVLLPSFLHVTDIAWGNRMKWK